MDLSGEQTGLGVGLGNLKQRQPATGCAARQGGNCAGAHIFRATGGPVTNTTPIAKAIYGMYLNGKRMLGMRDPEIITRVNGTMVCHTCAIQLYQLRAYRLGEYQDPPNFKPGGVGGKRPSISPRPWFLFC